MAHRHAAEGAEPEAVETLVALARTGSKVETMSPEHHDMVLA